MIFLEVLNIIVEFIISNAFFIEKQAFTLMWFFSLLIIFWSVDAIFRQQFCCTNHIFLIIWAFNIHTFLHQSYKESHISSSINNNQIYYPFFLSINLIVKLKYFMAHLIRIFILNAQSIILEEKYLSFFIGFYY